LVRFEDGVAGELDMSQRLALDGVFAPPRDSAAFAQAGVHPELGTVVWPGGADLDQDGALSVLQTPLVQSVVPFIM